jgi:hypothetical protein
MELEEGNKLVAEKVMGWIMHPTWSCLAPPGYPSEEEMWTPWEEGWDDDEGDFVMTRKPIKGKLVPGVVMDGSGKPRLPDYFGDVASAWQVVERLLEILPQGDIHIEHYDHEGWCVSTCFDKSEGGWDDWVCAATISEAICAAALLAVGVELPPAIVALGVRIRE